MDNKVKIGVLVPQSRQFKNMDRDFIRGLKLALPNVKLYIESIGIGADEQMIIEKIQKLNLQEEINIIVGFFGHHHISAVYEYASGNDIFLLASDLGATLPFGQPALRGVYTNSYSLSESCYLLGQYLNQNNIQKVASATSYYDSGYSMLAAMEMSFTDTIGFSGHYITPFHPREDEDKHMEAHLNEVSPDVVFGFYSGLYATENAGFVTKNKIMHKYPFYVTPFTITDDIIEQHCNSQSDIYVVASWLGGSTEGCTFSETYKTQFHEEPNMFAMLGYEDGLVINELIKSEKVDNMHEIIDKMLDIKPEGPRGLIKFDQATNRTIYHHNLYKLQKDTSTTGYSHVQTLENNGQFIQSITSLAAPLKTGGWQNAYLCH